MDLTSAEPSRDHAYAGPELTEAGKELVRLCNLLGVMIDFSHMDAAGFEDVAVDDLAADGFRDPVPDAIWS
jgi:microsomal dipeptidase-like Zn-dependent dipeptidase